MTVNLITTAHSDDIEQVTLALAHADQRKVSAALLAAMETRSDAAFDLILPIAISRRALSSALSEAAELEYFHGIKALSPEASSREVCAALQDAILASRTEVVECIAAHLQPGFDASASFECARRAGNAAALVALAPIATESARQSALSSAALAGSEMASVLATFADAKTAITDLLEFRSWSSRIASIRAGERNPVAAAPPSHVAAADFLLPLVSEAERQEIIAAHPPVLAYPNAKAIHHMDKLDQAISEPRPSSSPRM